MLWLAGFFLLMVATSANSKKLHVDVYYEALCPDSINFVTTQLYPAYKKIAKFIDLDLVPFGKATVDNSTGHWQFTCQHGPLECYNNEVHACVLANYSLPTSVDFINCAMSSDPNSRLALQLCAYSADVDWSSVQACLGSGEADALFVQNGIKTKAVTPAITFIPTIIFNGVYSEKLEDEAIDAFLKVVCELIKVKPDACKSRLKHK